MCRKCENDARIAGDPNDPIVIQQFLDQEHAWFRETIRRHGWAIRSVSGTSSAGGRIVRPPFAYTVGLWGFRHPEIVVFGVSGRVGQGLLNQLGERVRGGTVLRAGDELATSGPPVRLFELPNPGEVIFTANAFYERPPHDSVPALQAMYPDAHGTWPWEPDCHLCPGAQPMPGTFKA